jgi:peptide deformylase
MKAAIAAEDDAVAIAAPQIGVSLRIFVVAGKVFDMLLGKELPEGSGSAENADGAAMEAAEPETEDMVFINPEIVKLSKDKKVMEEGCLSARYLYGNIERAKKAKVRAMDEKGKAFEVGGSGLLAQIFQHETDHLDGKLFIDTATDIENLPPEEMERTGRAKKKIA